MQTIVVKPVLSVKEREREREREREKERERVKVKKNKRESWRQIGTTGVQCNLAKLFFCLSPKFEPPRGFQYLGY